ncbi:Hsp70 family protein, partial [Streptomyces sp. SID5910]|uniref:Hsp70 family protein n=1 Tax=Streptomyces sp. SID5910 TaxID=2690312 RepID=UPI001371F286
MIGIDLGHRFGRVGRIGPDGEPAVTATALEGTDGVLEPRRALPLLFGPAPAGTAAAAAEPDRQAVLGIPATGGREDELRRAAENAGLDVARVVPDPVAVALHYGAVDEGVDRTVLVCDQGATTLELTVLAVTPDLTVRLVRTRAHRLGGDDWDAALADALAGRLPDGVDPLRAAERLRRALGTSDEDDAAETVEDAAGGRHRLTLDRAVLDRAVAPLRQRTLDAVAEQLTAPGPAVDTVLLAGGLCATPGRRAEIEELPAAQGLTVRSHLPELAVVRGLLALRDFPVLRIVDGPAPDAAR